jgi:hypothetical protein
MRLAFFVLLLANLAFHVWSAGYLGNQKVGREPERLAQQIAPEKIRIVTVADRPAEKPPVAADPTPCRQVSGLSADDTAKLRKALADKEGVTVTGGADSASIAHWVLVPRLASRSAAEAKLGELQRREVNEGTIVADPDGGPFAISLRVFPRDEAAQEYLAELRAKGVRSAVVEAREKAPAGNVLEVRGPQAQLQALEGLLPPEVGATVAECPTPDNPANRR